MNINQEASSAQEGGKKRPRIGIEAQHQETTVNNHLQGNLFHHKDNDGASEMTNDNRHNESSRSNRRRILNEEDIHRMKLEAIFHPKFENENQNDPQIRKQMIDNVSRGEGVLEVSLKHSGSLVLWSGGKRYYSKNGIDNIFTHVGEILLRQHFARAWIGDTNGDGIDDSIQKEVKYNECSEYVESNRLTLSFEIVTSVLGHHGDLPKRDFLILIAVADRSTGTFYSTTQVMQIAQRFRLPHNDVWIFQSMQSASRLFDLYDNSRETGLAKDVIETLNEAADGGHMKSLYPHTVFQGDILEGIVIRFVRIATENERQSMSELCLQSDHILERVPPEMVLTIPSSSCDSSGPVHRLNTNLRQLFDQNDSDMFASIVEKLFNESTDENEMLRRISKFDKKDINLPSVAMKLLQDDTIDFETHQICSLIQTLDALKLSVTYHTVLERNETPDGMTTSQRYLCTIHILHDAGHQKYHIATRTSGSMALFRGFSIELITKEMMTTEKNVVLSTLISKMDKARLKSDEVFRNVDDGKLILKMKFLPYMVRTFICRNGLSILKKKGTDAFNTYAFDQLKRWGMSKAAVDKWIGFFHAWGIYCESPSQTNSEGIPLPTLTPFNYLHHFYHFQTLFSSGFFRTMKKQTSSFYGLVVVVGIQKEKMKDFAVSLNSILGCTRISTDINNLTEVDIARSLQNGSGGIICTAIVTEGVKQLRLLAKRYKENIFMVMVGCSKEEIEASFAQSENSSSKELKKTVGMTNGWKKNKVACSIEVPYSCISNVAKFETNDLLQSTVQKLRDASESSMPDNRPGMLVFFPSIPGCGKSTLCSNLTTDSLKIDTDRDLIVKEGDKTVGKFWPLALQQKMKYPSSILVADKNTPPASWQSVDSLCSKTRGVAVCALPDTSALEDTIIDVHSPDENGQDVFSQHHFPFSLPFLALCMSRVLARQPNTHNGNLDAATKDACMIVVKFYCFYRKYSVSSLLKEISKLGQQNNKVIRFPFFKDDSFPEIPKDLKETLETAIGVQIQEDLKLAVTHDRLIVEQELRNVLNNHQDYIKSLPAAEEFSRDSFMNQLKNFISALGDNFEERDIVKSIESTNIRIVSLDFNRQEVNSVLTKIAHDHPDVNDYLQEREFECVQNIETNDNNKGKDRFINKTHCTFAHDQQISQQEIKHRFDHMIGVSCEVSVNAILFDDNVAALDLSIPAFVKGTTSIPIPTPVNKFTHITVWCGKGT